ncbi:ETC complex I subunit motif protein (macronuclear) [Tetrahymena thermophila SB210]|uniref:NADH dehydrogenase [ubiquinone] iron-sulfur protein 4, mitochondrial n=1 Tax=Tetrahymena thermophila (strain SB210) TaxID=312017 RepID=I7MK61_TETTS|nr:ETC complex I subunit motif protein [Tetrahymena thermophila SB210]7TGH_S4 Chain S4, NADH dehydrogenase [ubiquinone] iron-sulfur protein 4, mitochondrial [Tetrahymena thermophila]8B6F_AR Chain AR, NADH dehydrogenase [ubiquinone] iron-sulfur protein 4, mitochondrial [Tetrahymena thermophila SB210]8BQS_AR Chain AR, NADH dehydrogenase [ubiquinone] iron-sulfur protein 4, mitochondrial [Tetrahymena thermophila SB210]8GYM_S4 Chain S4, NADH dehydrogenase [ubiquinone] iron-sulfur protein 4, mitochon|eukprot:XP_001028104.3 ETC complex I subunit motif protein [Tetrahymena thermophila SB210]
MLLPKNAIQSARYFEIQKIPAKIAKTANEKILSVGVAQKNNIQPKTVTAQGQIGFVQHPQLDSSCQYTQFYTPQRRDIRGRVARIYIQDTNHMHDTPQIPEGYKWTLEFERQAQYKTPWMGWSFNGDTFSKRNHYFCTLEDAISYCKQMGFGYEVSFPRSRYHTRKSYADNMLWPGHDNAVDEDC